MEVRHRQHMDLDPGILRQLSDVLTTVNPFIEIYKTARERITETRVEEGHILVILNPQMRLII